MVPPWFSIFGGANCPLFYPQLKPPRTGGRQLLLPLEKEKTLPNICCRSDELQRGHFTSSFFEMEVITENLFSHFLHKNS
jgi:hypothetical protein